VSARPEEKLGAQYDPVLFARCREETIALAGVLAHSLAPGSTEDEAHALFKRLLTEQGISKVWHPTKIRFGQNTLCNFREPGEEGVRLSEGDLFFVDIGPVIHGHEGDYGETYRCGGGSDPLIRASRDVFDATEKAWRERGLTGGALYEVARAAAVERGFDLNMNMDGHRIGDFPHVLHHKGDLKDFDYVPAPGVWILEIHVVDRTRHRAAFFEDVLGVSEL
jgi:Xaa-Pro aminopeptidase